MILEAKKPMQLKQMQCHRFPNPILPTVPYAPNPPNQDKGEEKKEKRPLTLTDKLGYMVEAKGRELEGKKKTEKGRRRKERRTT
jgi:hypothetical protein